MKKIFITLVLLGMYSCATTPGNLCIDNLIKDYPNYQVYVIIPSSVCKSCSSAYDQDMMEAYKSNKVAVIFNCSVRDTFSIEYYFNELSKKHLIIDTLNQYIICDSIPESIYPAIIYMNDNKINKIEYYNSKNVSAYEKLKSHLR